MPNPIQAPDITQLINDIIAVFVCRTKSFDSFPPAYQQRMLTYYRFSADRYNSPESYVAQRTRDTLDIV